MRIPAAALVFRVLILALLLGLGVAASAQMVAGEKIPGYDVSMGLTKDQAATAYTAQFISGTAQANVLWPGEQGTFTFQLVNTTDKPIQTAGKVEVIAYGTKGRPGDIWVPEMFRTAVVDAPAIQVDIKAKGYANFTVSPRIPAPLGAYALVVDLGPLGRQFVTSLVRTFKADPTRVQFPKLGMDVSDVDVLQRLGCKSIRYGFGYKPTTDPDFPQWLDNFTAAMKKYQEHNVMVIVEIGGGGPQPMGRWRSHLDDKGVGPMQYPGDYAWLPSSDPDFTKLCKLIAGTYGYPKGPVTAMKIWNEPWEGSSIAGWGADMLRFREITVAMGKGVEQARADDGVQVLLGGTDSSSNTLDKFFADGTDEYMKYLDFCSIHYQGMSPPSTIKAWVNRKSPFGRVKIWDTESWVANTDDRVAAVMAANISSGHDRAVGVYGGNICSDKTMYWNFRRVFDEKGKQQEIKPDLTWSVAASVGAAQHFLGERDFHQMLFKNGLPWVMVFHGLLDKDGNENLEDGTIVVVGDLGEEFGPDGLLFRTARGLREIAHKAALKQQLASLPAAAKAEDRQKLEDAIKKPEVLSGASMTIKVKGNAFGLYDFYGNPVPAKHGKIVVPLDGRGFFLRGNGKDGSFAKLLKAVYTARIDGIEPLAPVAHDFTAPIDQHPALHLSLTNVLNRPVKGLLTVAVDGLQLDMPKQTLAINGNETKELYLRVTGGAARESNSYHLALSFNAGHGLVTVHEEDIHVNYIAKRTITVDGKLDDWAGVLPQTISANEKIGPTLTEFAWQPYKQFDTSVKKGFATGYLAYDDKNFYFAAKVADSTPEDGMVRFETRDDDEYFYPEKSFTSVKGGGEQFSARWTGQIVPRYSETYTFITATDDGGRLWVNGQQLINDWQSHGASEYKGTPITLTAGQRYDITMEYFQGGGGAAARLLWESPSQKKEIIPTSQLYPTADATTASGLTAKYYIGTSLSALAVTRVDAKIDFTWDSAHLPDPALAKETLEELTWPAGVRRYSYRKEPELPAGNFPSHDNVQIAFNVLPADQKAWYPCPPGTMPGYTGYQDTDYEYALNPVAAKYGGGTEIWRLQYPGMPHKHFYPRQPKSPFDGPVKDGKLLITRDATTRFVECAIPWTELPEVKKALDAGKPIKFSFRVNDNDGGPCMELSRQRSVAKRNGSFTVDWVEHWANELEFGVEK